MMLRVIAYFAKSLRSFEVTLLSRASVSPSWYFIKTMSVYRTVYEIFSVKERRNLETGGRGRSRSLKMALFDRSYTTFYWSAIVSIINQSINQSEED